MSSPTRPRPGPDRAGRLFSGGVALATILAFGVFAIQPAQADPSVTPSAGHFTIKGAGYGHGWGMSQYGAYGAAREGLGWKQILAFYYRGTKLTRMAGGTTIRARISADSDEPTRAAARGLTVRDGAGRSFRVPTGSRYRSWRIIRSGSGYKLSYRNRSGSNVNVATELSTSTWKFSSADKIIKLVLPGGTVRPYRGSMMVVKREQRQDGQPGQDGRLRQGRGALEMPTSWAPNAVRAQAVAARSYGDGSGLLHYTGYDVCDTTACQVYGEVNAETPDGNAAVRATRG